YIHVISKHSLHQAMKCKRLRAGIATQQGICPQCGNCCIEHERIGGYRLQNGTEIRRTPCKHSLGNSIGVKKGTQPKEVGSGRIRTLYQFKGQSECSSYRLRMSCTHSTTEIAQVK